MDYFFVICIIFIFTKGKTQSWQHNISVEIISTKETDYSESPALDAVQDSTNVTGLCHDCGCCLVSKWYLTLFVTPWTVAREVPLSIDFPGNTRVGCNFFLQGIFLTQGSNPDLPYCKQILYHPSHQGGIFLMNTHIQHFSWIFIYSLQWSVYL